MSAKRLIASSVAAVILGAAAATAQDVTAAVEARQGQFKLYAFNLGALVPMAQGNVDYDAEVAQAAADNLALLTALDQTRLWPEGSDNAAIDGTRALPVIWEDMAALQARFGELQDAVATLQNAAGEDLDSMRAALGPVGGVCSACHEANRAPE